MRSAPYARYSSRFFLEYLDNPANAESIANAGNIILKMLDESTPEYQQENIHSIVEKLYEAGNEENIDWANRICNTYGSRGHDFLRDLYEKYSS